MKKMVISEIKARRIYAEEGKYCCVAEAEVETEDGDVYVAMQAFDGYEVTVSKESMFAFIAGDGGSAPEEFLEDYSGPDGTEKSAYVGVFAILQEVIGRLGEWY